MAYGPAAPERPAAARDALALTDHPGVTEPPAPISTEATGMLSPLARFTTLAPLALAVFGVASAQELTLPSDPLAGTVIESAPTTPPGAVSPSIGNPVPMAGDVGTTYGAPASAYSSGSSYNPTLGAHLRATYTSESYAQEAGTLSLGTMKLLDLGDAVTFLDGQVTMNDESHVGYNLGLGYRWMTLPLLPSSPDAQKIMGVSVWSDGQSVGGDNFFPQVGVALEFLGERLDFRANGYAPVGPRTRTRDFVDTGSITYSGNTLAPLLIGVEDTSLTLGEAELAGRIADLDAWVFGGVYGFNGGDVDATGGKVGLRGYATPDLLLSIAITNDDEFDTNAIFTASWFIGRTRAENCPTGELRDRFREPVLRNNYVATQQRAFNGAGAAIVDANGESIRIVHVDSTAAAGGDGTFERPLNSLNTVFANSQTDDIVLAHGGSTFNSQQAVLRDGQVFVGEGANNAFSVTTLSLGTVDLPETAPGARAGAVPIVNVAAGSSGVVLADDNTVENLAFNGGLNAIVSDATSGSFNPTLRDLTITGATGDGVVLNTVVRADADDVDDDDNTSETINVMGNVVITDVTFNNVAGSDIDINAEADTADTNSGETIAITNVTSNNTGNVNGGPAISIANTNSTIGDAVTITNFAYNGGTNRNGGLLLTDTAGPVTVTESEFTGGDGPAVDVDGATGVVNIGGTNDVTDVAGQAVRVVGNTAAVNIGAEISTASTVNGGAVFVQANEGIVSFTGAIEANNVNAVTIDDAQANVTFGVDADVTHTGTGDAFTVTGAGDNVATNSQVTVSGDVTGGEGRVVNIVGGDDDIVFNGPVTSSAGQGINIQDRADNTGAIVLFNGQTTVTTAAGSAANGVNLADNGDQSVVSFGGGLDIDTDAGTGRGLVSNSGVVNVTGTGNTITTATGRGIELTGGSSSAGVTFADVDVNGADTAIFLDDFDGTVTANDGVMTTTGTAVQAVNSGVVLSGVAINSATNVAVDARIEDNTNRAVTLTDVDLNGDDVNLRTQAGSGGALTASIDNTGSTAGAAGVVGAVNFDSDGSGNSSLGVTDVRTDGEFDYNVTGSGNLSVTMTNVDSEGAANINASLDVNGAGNGLLTMNDVNLGGALNVASLSTASGDIVLSVTNSGNDAGEAFTSVVVNDLGDGVATASFTNSQSAGGIDFDSARTGNASLTVTGGTYGGDITASAAGTMIGNFTAQVTNVNTFTGIGTQVVFDAQNTGTATLQASGLTLNTQSNDAAVVMTLGTTVTTADVTASSNNLEALNASAYLLDVNGGAVDFLFSGNTMTNASNTQQTALVTHGGSTLNATLTGNNLTNSGTADELLLQNASGSTVNLNTSGNGPAFGVVYEFENLSAAADFRIRGADAAAVDGSNPASINFQPAAGSFTFDSNLAVPTP